MSIVERLASMRRWLFIVGSLIGAGILFLWLNTRYKLIDMSSLSVSVDPALALDSVQVRRGFYSINRANDRELFDKQNDRVIFDGWQVGLLGTDYGENDFLITYGDRYYLQFRHWIFNSNHQHDYNLSLAERNDSLFLSVDIDGPDAMRFSHPMNLISDADSLLCNGPIDHSKVIYNMVEMEEPTSRK